MHFNGWLPLWRPFRDHRVRHSKMLTKTFLFWPFWPYWPFLGRNGQYGQYGHVLFLSLPTNIKICTGINGISGINYRSTPTFMPLLPHHFFCFALFALSALSPSKVQIVQIVQCHFFITTDFFFSPFIFSFLYSIIYIVYNTEHFNL